MNIRTLPKTQRLTYRFAWRHFEIHDAQGREALADETGHVLRFGFPTDRLAQGGTRLLFHRTTVGGCANPMSGLHVVVENADHDTRHGSTLPTWNTSLCEDRIAIKAMSSGLSPFFGEAEKLRDGIETGTFIGASPPDSDRRNLKKKQGLRVR